jgi:hypothetical protein
MAAYVEYCLIAVLAVCDIYLLRDLDIYGILLSLLYYNKAGLGKRRVTLSL